MIDLYYWTTPNGHKITMFLEETGLKYKIFPVNIAKGDQFKPEFLAIAPNNRIPALLDHEPKGGGKPISIFESGAMLLYLAEKTGKFLPADLYGRYDAIQWTFWQMGGLGPMAGQNHHFRNYAVEKIKYAIDRYVNETNRLYGVLNKRLSDREFIAGRKARSRRTARKKCRCCWTAIARSSIPGPSPTISRTPIRTGRRCSAARAAARWRGC